MAKYQITEDVRAQGFKPDTKQTLSAMFPKGDEIEGTIINQDGFTLITDGVYWRFPLDKLFAIDEARLPDGKPKPLLQNPDRPLPVYEPQLPIPSEPIWKHAEMPKYIGAAIAGLIGMKVGEKISILPGPLNWLLFTGLGVFAGYKGTKYLLEKGKGNQIKEGV